MFCYFGWLRSLEPRSMPLRIHPTCKPSFRWNRLSMRASSKTKRTRLRASSTFSRRGFAEYILDPPRRRWSKSPSVPPPSHPSPAEPCYAFLLSSAVHVSAKVAGGIRPGAADVPFGWDEVVGTSHVPRSGGALQAQRWPCRPPLRVP